MYIETVPNRGSPPAILLRESYREGGKVKKRTLLNLTNFPPHIVAGLRTLLKGGRVAPDAADPSSFVARCRTAMSPPCWASCVRAGLTACSAARVASAISSPP